ncbi:killer cell lectin-like receptor subfamily B member 1B allele B isoform X2 [Athene noctua]|uniref:killer cell lectin-like receptor subfamily B member 1B allele B isoform X2 n=1 Tax=Athene noctua TaxID=126797 RepID=UPI003EB821EC
MEPLGFLTTPGKFPIPGQTHPSDFSAAPAGWGGGRPRRNNPQQQQQQHPEGLFGEKSARIGAVDPPGGVFSPNDSSPPAAAAGCPQWHRPALWAGWTGTLLLGVAVGYLALHQQPEDSGSCRHESGAVGDGNTPERICWELRERLCPPGLREGGGCRFCPPRWTPYGTKCLWVSDGQKNWNQSREDCATRGAELLDFLNQTLQKPTTYFWIGLSAPPAGQGWTWLNGSRLAPDRFLPSPEDQSARCGALRGGRIGSGTCGSVLRWICQKEAPQL